MGNRDESNLAPGLEDTLAPDKVGIVLGIPSRGSVRLEWAAMLKSMVEPVNMTWAIKTTIGRPVDQARNIIARYALEVKANYLFFVDDDVLCPNQTLRRMIYSMEQHPEWDLLSGIYVVKDPHAPDPLVFAGGNPDGAYWDWKFGEHFEIDSCGMGCCLIRGSALDKVDAPWFEYHRSTHGQVSKELGEDIDFCMKLKEAGGVLMADGGILCGHIDDVGRVYSLDFASRPIQNADQEKINQYLLMSPEGKAKPPMVGAK